MKKILASLAVAALAFVGSAVAQQPYAPGPGPSPFTGGVDLSTATGTLQTAQFPAVSGGDCTTSAGSVVFVCTKSNGVAFGSLAFLNSVNNSNWSGTPFGSLAYLSTINNSNWSGTVLSVANGGNGTASPALTASTCISLSGTWPNYTITGTCGAGGGGTVTSVTVGAGLYTNGSTTIPSVIVAERRTDGRLTNLSGTPVQQTSSTSNATSIYYAPYVGNLVSIYNGTNLQAYQFTSSASDTGGLTLELGSNWAANTAFDVYVTLITGNPTLCTVAWSTATSRATALARYNGLLTNGALATCRYSDAATTSMAVNQGTYLGSFYTNASTGHVDWTLGSAASGGGAASLAIWNYYNRVITNAVVTDNGTIYLYSSSTVRQARASTGNQVSFMVGLQEDAFTATYNNATQTSATSGTQAASGLGLNTKTSLTAFFVCYQEISFSFYCQGQPVNLQLVPPTPGLNYIAAVEASLTSDSQTFDQNSGNTIFFNFPM